MSNGVAIPAQWRALFEGRRVAFAELPPAPVRPARGFVRFLIRALPLLVWTAITIGASMWIARASGRWFVGVIVAVIMTWIALLLAVGVVGALKVERTARVRRRERALDDPIGKLLPNRGMSRKQFRDPASYAALLALEHRPALVFDTALFDVVQLDKMVKSLAPRGQMPEPEILATSSIPAGSAFIGVMLIAQSSQFWIRMLAAVRTSAPLHWSMWGGAAMVGVGLYLVLRDPWLRRKLNLPRVFGADFVIGAGWIKDGKGEIWTVDESIALITLAGGGMEIRLLKPGKVLSFYLPMILGKPGTGRVKAPTGITGLGLRKRAKGLAANAARGAAESVGIETTDRADIQMPSSNEPLRLLLSSWLYPEPRTDLAMRDQ